MSELLKPCPFCGEAVKTEYDADAWGWDVYCDGCGTSSGYNDSKAASIDAWNTRPGEDALAAEVAQLRAALVMTEQPG